MPAHYVLNDKKFPPGTPVGHYATLEKARAAAQATLAVCEDVDLEIYLDDPSAYDRASRLATRKFFPLEE